MRRTTHEFVMWYRVLGIFQSTSSVRRTTCWFARLISADIFQSTSSVRRTTGDFGSRIYVEVISIHVLRAEDDFCRGRGKFQTARFQSTSSVRRTTADHNTCKTQMYHFNPRPPCGGRRAALGDGGQNVHISIHVLRVEDDSARPGSAPPAGYFNPRPPCGGRRAG